MDEPQRGQSQSGQHQQQQRQQQPGGRAAEDAAEEQPAGPTPPDVATAAAAEDTTPADTHSGSAPGQYDPRESQSPHPDDAVNAGATNTTAGSGKAAKTKGGKAVKKGGGKGDADGEPCSNCGTLGATRKCSQCRQTQYCGEACFKVRRAGENTGGRERAWGAALSCGAQCLVHSMKYAVCSA